MFWKKIRKLRTADISPGRGKNITLSINGRDEFSAILGNAVKAAAQQAGYDLTMVNAMNSVDLQISQVKGASKRGEEAMIVNLVDPNTAPEILAAAGDMKIEFIGRAPTDMKLLNDGVIYVGPDEDKAGRLQGEWLAQYFGSLGKKKIRYILLEGIPALYSSRQRTESVLKTLADRDMDTTPAVPPVIANYDRNEAMMDLLPILSSGVDFDVIIANNDAMALGAIDAMERLGMDPTKTIIVGIDGMPDALKALRDGKLSMTVFQDANVEANVIVQALTNMLTGKPINAETKYFLGKDSVHTIWLPLQMVTKLHVPPHLGHTAANV